MNIALALPHGAPYSEKRLVGVKRVVYTLAKYIQKYGHSVTLIAPSDSASEELHLPIEKTIPSAKSMDISVFDDQSFYYATIHASLTAQLAHKFDIVHSHMDYAFLPFIQLLNTPVLATIHGTNYRKNERALFKQWFHTFKAVGLSKKTIELTSDFIHYDWQVYNGIETDLFPFYEGEDSRYMYFLGRINPVKGVDKAIEVAKTVKQQLVITGFTEVGGKDFYQHITDISKNNTYVSIETDHIFSDKEKAEYYRKARLFLFPVQYEETFGLVLAEAMAAGTPVVAFARGAVPEIIRDGITGFLVNPSDNDIRGDWIIKKTGIEGLCEAVQKIYTLPPAEYKIMRKNCRKHIEEHFSAQKMVESYIHIYKELINS